MRPLILALVLTFVTTILSVFIYTRVRGEAANSPNDKLGETIFTVLVPAVFVLSLGIGVYIENRRER